VVGKAGLFELREHGVPYSLYFKAKKDDIGMEITFFWNNNYDILVR